MKSRQVLNGLLTSAVTVAVLAGCGGSSGGGDTIDAADARSGLFELSKCARANGQPNFPDPIEISSGNWGYPPSADGLRVPDACTSLKLKLKGNFANDKAASAEDMAKLREFAKCVREHGVQDWPDPEADGTFVLPQRIKQVGDSITNGPVRACLHLAPGGNIETKDVAGSN